MDTTSISLPLVTALPGATASIVAWRSRDQLHVTVIAKATFAFAPEAVMLCVEPQEILLAEVYHGAYAPRTIRFASDRAPYLNQAGVVFTGDAHAPPGTVVQSMPVRITIFDGGQVLFDKTLVVQDDSPFQRMPIVYERAVRGADGQENPFGVDVNVANILDPRVPSRLAGFGPIARAWPARRRLLGGTPRSALDGPIQEIPDVFDWSYFQSAPPDQRIAYLRGGESIELHGLHPTVPHLRTRLPEVRGLAHIHGLSAFGVAEGQPLELHADTLRIDGQAERCTLVFRRSFPVSGEGALAAARIVAGVELAGVPLAWPSRLEDIKAKTMPATGLAGHDTTVATRDDAAHAPSQPALPFRPGLAPEAIAHSAGAPAPGQDTGTLALGPEEAVPIVAPPLATTLKLTPQTLSLTQTQNKRASNQPAVPFQPAPPGAVPPARAVEEPMEHERVSTGTLALLQEEAARVTSQDALPFSPPVAATTSASAPHEEPASPPQVEVKSDAQESLPAKDKAVAPEPPESAAEPPAPRAAPPAREKQRPPGHPRVPAASPALKASLYQRFERK